MSASEYKVAGMRVFTADWMAKDEALIIPDRRTLETDEEYWQRAKSQAVLMRGLVPSAMAEERHE